MQNNPLKVAYLVGGLPFGGIERWLYGLLLEYQANPLVQGRVFNLSGSGLLMPEYLAAGHDVECVVNDNIPAIATHRLDTTRKLRSRLKQFAPDIIHTVHFSANYHGRLAAIGLGVPVITHLRNIKHEKKVSRRLADKLLSYATTEYFAVSKAVADVVQSDHNLAKRPVRVLYNAIKPERYDIPPVDLHALYGIEGPVVLAVSRFVPQKNLDLLIQAIALLRQKGQAVSLVLVGKGPEMPALQYLSNELGIDRHVIFAGFQENVAEYMKACDIFAMPSDFEGFPIAQLEAMYCGLPCVVSEHVPMLEIASEASLVCDLSPESIAEKIQILLDDAPLRSRMATKAEEIASEHTMKKYSENLYAIYQEILGKKAQ